MNYYRNVFSRILVISFFLFKPLTAFAANLPDEMTFILRSVLAGGDFNSSVHADFWNKAPQNLITEFERDENKILESILVSVNMQREFWRSIRLSYQNRKVIKTSGFERIKQKSNKLGWGATEQIKNYESMLISAAVRQPVTTRKGEILFDDILAETVLLKLDMVFSNIKKLANPNWTFD
jgi:hypothetical protein